MPKLFRVSGQETVRALEKLGFVQIRQRGSHVILKKQTTQGDRGNHPDGSVGVWFRFASPHTYASRTNSRSGAKCEGRSVGYSLRITFGAR